MPEQTNMITKLKQAELKMNSHIKNHANLRSLNFKVVAAKSIYKSELRCNVQQIDMVCQMIHLQISLSPTLIHSWLERAFFPVYVFQLPGAGMPQYWCSEINQGESLRNYSLKRSMPSPLSFIAKPGFIILICWSIWNPLVFEAWNF